ncbi:hypothetical protein AOLI_G00161210 [Acnodon oligacanthus]
MEITGLLTPALVMPPPAIMPVVGSRISQNSLSHFYLGSLKFWFSKQLQCQHTRWFHFLHTGELLSLLSGKLNAVLQCRLHARLLLQLSKLDLCQFLVLIQCQLPKMLLLQCFCVNPVLTFRPAWLACGGSPH